MTKIMLDFGRESNKCLDKKFAKEVLEQQTSYSIHNCIDFILSEDLKWFNSKEQSYAITVRKFIECCKLPSN